MMSMKNNQEQLSLSPSSMLQSLNNIFHNLGLDSNREPNAQAAEMVTTPQYTVLEVKIKIMAMGNTQ